VIDASGTQEEVAARLGITQQAVSQRLRTALWSEELAARPAAARLLSLAAPQAKKRIVAANGDATLRTTVFDVVRGFDWPAKFTARTLRNSFSDAWHGRESDLKEHLHREREKYAAAAERKDFDTAVIFAGEAVDLIDSVLPARDIVRRICG